MAYMEDNNELPCKAGFWNLEKSELSKMILGECVKSSTFQIGCCELDRWYIQLFPQGCQLSAKGFVSIFLCRSCTCDLVLKYKFSYTVYSATDQMVVSWPMKKRFDPDLVRWGFHTFGSSKKLMDNDEKNKIVLYYEISIGTNSFDLPRKKICYNDDSICISTNGCDIQVNRSILTNSSEMILEMTENSNRITLDHVKPPVVNEMLTFLHTATCPNFSALGEELLAVASDLRIVKLKIFCEKELAKTLETRNVAMLLRLASNNNATSLKHKALQFLVDNASAVCDTEGWKVLIQSHPKLVAEAFEALAENSKCNTP